MQIYDNKETLLYNVNEPDMPLYHLHLNIKVHKAYVISYIIQYPYNYQIFAITRS